MPFCLILLTALICNNISKAAYLPSVDSDIGAAATNASVNLLSPANDRTLNTTPSFSWSKARKAASYQIQVSLSNDPSFAAPTINAKVTATSYTPVTSLPYASYIWRVRGIDNSGSPEPWSSIFSFTIAASSITSNFFDDFSSYPAGVYYPDGATFGPWQTIFNGYGKVGVASDGANQYLDDEPRQSTSPSQTSSCLVVGPATSGSLTLQGQLFTAQQLRIGSPPNPWEVAWVLWNYTDNQHFYYFTPKTNGWELGKEDPAYPGNQRYLATGSAPQFPIGQWYNFKVVQSANKITVYINGLQIVTYTDTRTPYTAGKIGLYNEDSHVYFDNISLTQP
jgi:hypothetical protein